MRAVSVTVEKMRKYKRGRYGRGEKRMSLYLTQELGDRIKAESEARLESQNMVVNKILENWFRASDREVDRLQFTKED